MRKIKLTESDLTKIIQRVINEETMDVFDRKMLATEVLNRIMEYGPEYVEELKKLNDMFPSTKYKIEMPGSEVHKNRDLRIGKIISPKGETIFTK